MRLMQLAQRLGSAALGAVLLAACPLALNGTGREDAGRSPTDAKAADRAGDMPSEDVVPPADAPAMVDPPDFAWYLLNETSGTTAHDSTAHHYDVASLAGVTWGQGASFDGTGGGGFVAVAADWRQPPVSITAWLAPDSRVDLMANSHGITPFPPGAVSGDAPGQYGYGIGLTVWSGGSALAVEDVAYDLHGVGGAQFVVGTEYFVAVAIDASVATVYVDGQPVDQAAPKTPGPAAVATLALGFHNDDPAYGTKRFYAGRMRDVRVYKRALGASEVTALHAAGPTTGP